jgi:hypothetical protein
MQSNHRAQDQGEADPLSPELVQCLQYSGEVRLAD